MRDWDCSIGVLELRNYRKFESFHITFDDCMNVIVGNNGAGKTTLLNACAAAASSLLAKVEGSKSVGIRRSDARLITLEQGSAKIKQAQFPVVISAEGFFNRRPYSWSRELYSEKSRTTTKTPGASSLRERVFRSAFLRAMKSFCRFWHITMQIASQAKMFPSPCLLVVVLFSLQERRLMRMRLMRQSMKPKR